MRNLTGRSFCFALVAGGTGFGILRVPLSSGFARFVITVWTVVIFVYTGGSGIVEFLFVRALGNFALWRTVVFGKRRRLNDRTFGAGLISNAVDGKGIGGHS